MDYMKQMGVANRCFNCFDEHEYSDDNSNCDKTNCAFCDKRCKSPVKGGHFSATCYNAPIHRDQLMDTLNDMDTANT